MNLEDQGVVKERPILFNAAMVRAILEGRKTQTRRPIKPQPVYRENASLPGVMGLFWKHWNIEAEFIARTQNPYGQPGDRLWVRETHGWMVCDKKENGAFEGSEHGIYWSEGDGDEWFKTVYRADKPDLNDVEDFRWTPSIHMKRWASRILLDITNVRVERIQDITTDGIHAEGKRVSGRNWEKHLRDGFEESWERIYPGSWDRNDWVWVVEFKRVKP